MKTELKSLAVLQTGKVLAVLYAFAAAIMMPILLVSMAMNPRTAPNSKVTIIVVILYPLLGFIGGILLASFYNMAAKWVGGIRFTLQQSEEG
jgi:hypothetical protein